MQKASFNFHAQNLKDRNKALAWVQVNKPQTVVVLDDQNFASQCADLGVQYPILRVTTNDNDVHVKVGSFSEWWGYVKGKYADKRLVVHFCNEPHLNFPLLDSMIVDGINILHEQGYKGVWGNFSVGTPEPNDLKDTFHNAILSLQKYPDEQFLGLHEYLMGILPYAIPYYISRYKQLFQYYARNSIGIILTEFGTDFIQQIHDIQRLPNIRGYKDHLSYYQSQGAVDPEASLMSQFKSAFDQFYNKDEEIKGVNFFCYGNSGGFDSYDFEGSDLINSFNIFETDIVTPTNPSLKIINVKEGLNLRDTPTTAGKVLKLMKYGEQHTVYASPIVGANTYNWQPVDSGWAVNFVDNAPAWIDIPENVVWTKALSVKFYSQRDANSNLKQNDCGYASDRMLMGWDYEQKGLTDPSLISVNDLVLKSPLMTSDSPQQLSDVLKVLNGFGVQAINAHGLVPDNIRTEIDHNRPVLVLVNYKHVNPMQITDLGHYMVIIGYNDTQFLFHDPYLLGANQIISEVNLDLALNDVQTGNIASEGYQGICLTNI